MLSEQAFRGQWLCWSLVYGAICFLSLRKTPKAVTKHNAAVIKAPSGHLSHSCHVPKTMTAKHIRAISTMSLMFMSVITTSTPLCKRGFCATPDHWLIICRVASAAVPHRGAIEFRGRALMDLKRAGESDRTQCYAFGFSVAIILRTTANAVMTHKAALINAPSGHLSHSCHVPTTTTAMNTTAISTVSLIFMGELLPPACCAGERFARG
ncbi:MAG: hypothetical protein NT105_12140 [Verrucomicrobia bacterium]|nr:hypothetical protein [Verrucomicrobiota bacterium]